MQAAAASVNVYATLDLATTTELRLAESHTSSSVVIKLLWNGTATGNTKDSLDNCSFSDSLPYALPLTGDERLEYVSSQIAYGVRVDDGDENQNFNVNGGVVAIADS